MVAFLVYLASFVPGPAPDAVCTPDTGPEYYAIDLIPTKRVPAARRASGIASVSFASSPFGIAVSSEGHYIYDLALRIDNLKPAPEGEYVAWVSTPNLKEVMRLGALTSDGTASGQVTWNKFLVIVTLETVESGTRWQGPVVLRGLSRSGFMHTMAGHGPFQQEPCATFGYY